jgi:hypothetical protein
MTHAGVRADRGGSRRSPDARSVWMRHGRTPRSPDGGARRAIPAGGGPPPRFARTPELSPKAGHAVGAARQARRPDRAIVRRATRCDAGPAARSRDRATRHVAIRHETPPTAPCSRRSRSTRSPAPAGRCVRGCRATSSAGRRARATRSTSARHVALSPAGKARNELGAAVGELGEECRRRVRRLATVIHGMPGDLWLAFARGTGVVRVRRWPYGRTAEAHGSDCARSAPRPDRCRPAQRRAACDGARRTFPISLSISIIDSS